MKFLLDENIPKAAAELLRRLRHEVEDIRGTDQEGIDDLSLLRLAQNHGAILLTTDRDFSHTIPFQLPNHRGVVVIALHQPARRAILTRFEWFLDRFGNTDISDRVFELRDRTYLVSPVEES